MKKIWFTLLSTITISGVVRSQCDVRVTANTDTIVCGDAVILNVFGKGQGPVVFQENFNSGSPTGWAFTQQATFTNPCSPQGVDGTPHIWMGNNSGVPRSLETNPYDFSNAIAGATICFDLLFATQGGNSPCEGPDEPDEGVYLQYRIGNGPWITINYFDPNGGTDPLLVNWNNWCFQLPQAALTSNVSIRWFQDNDSGADYDHWGIDNVQIYFNDPTFTITVSNNQGNIFTFPQGSSGGNLPPQAPRQTTTYNINMTNTSGTTCTDSITIFVKDPFFEVTAGRDTTICEGQCVVLNSSAKVVKSYAQTRTFANTQTTAIATGIAGAATSINVAVAGMNNPNILPGMIQSVCISNLTFFGFNLFPPGQQTLGDLRIRLICPDSSIIVLVPTGVTTSTSPLQGYTNTCFTATSTTNIATASPPYTGSYQPNEPFNNLVGCSANGVWKMEISVGNAASFGSGTFTGWSITLNDPEISYNGNFTWSPTTDMTNPTSPTPTICPTATRDYVISVSDTAACKTVRDTVKVSVQQNCCNFTIATTVTQPSCGASDGAINITPSPVGTYTYSWNDGNTSGSRTNLPAGTYNVTVTDVANGGCTRDTVIILNSNSNLNLQLSNPVNPSCGQNNGSVTVTLSGGTAPYVVTIINGGNTQTLNFPIATAQTVPNLGVGTYTIAVIDAQQCQQTQTITLTVPNAPTITNVAVTDATCNGNDGAIAITASGSGTLSISWSNGGNNFTETGLAAGSYSYTISDGNGCQTSGTVIVGIPAACCSLQVALNSVEPGCSGPNTGSVTAIISGANGNVTYIWSNSQTGSTISNLGAGTYSVTVTDAASCSTQASVTLNETQPAALELGANRTVCSGSDATLTAPSGFASYLWSTGDTTETITVSETDFYSLTVTNASGCTAEDALTVSITDNPVIKLPTDTAIYENNPLSLRPQIDGNTTGANYLWLPADGLSCNDCPSPVANPDDTITYTLFFTDANGCKDTASINVNVVKGAKIYMPNVFTPNGDGKNDILFPLGIGVKSIEWKIFNRWGELVFVSPEMNIGWDGSLKGVPQPAGVYVYVMDVSFKNNTTRSYNGSVTLVR